MAKTLSQRVIDVLGPAAVPGVYDRDLGRTLSANGGDYVDADQVLAVLTGNLDYQALRARLLALGVTPGQVETLLRARDDMS